MNDIDIYEKTPLTNKAISAFIKEVFDEFVGPDYAAEGKEEFYKYISTESIKNRSAKNHFMLFALDKHKQLIGLLEMRNKDHISLLFVRKDMQRKGIGRKLLSAAIEKVKPKEISVNSGPNSIKAYEKMGFRKCSEEKTVNGIRFTPMSLDVGCTSDNSSLWGSAANSDAGHASPK